LTASFELSPNVNADVATRIKMGQSSNVRAVVKADGKIYYTAKEVKVTIGGCGG
jgi:sulfur-oxidizing protein SoxY